MTPEDRSNAVGGNISVEVWKPGIPEADGTTFDNAKHIQDRGRTMTHRNEPTTAIRVLSLDTCRDVSGGIAMLLPAVQSAREAARRTKSSQGSDGQYTFTGLSAGDY